MRTDTALDMYIELAPALDGLITNIRADENARKQLAQYSAGKMSNTEIMTRLLPAILACSKEECYAILAAYEGVTVEDVKAQNISVTLTALKALFNDKELTSFFTPAPPSTEPEGPAA